MDLIKDALDLIRLRGTNVMSIMYDGLMQYTNPKSTTA